MTNYVKTTDFAGKDALVSGNPAKAVKGVDLGIEFDAIATMSATKMDASAGANPTASVGLAAVNGVAASYMRSDSAPALSQAIVPTWTGVHTHSATPVFNAGITSTTGTFSGAAGSTAADSSGAFTTVPFYSSASTPGYAWNETGAAANARLWRAVVNGGVLRMRITDDAGATAKNWLAVTRSGASITDLSFGGTADNPTYTFLGTGAGTANGPWTFNGSAGHQTVNINGAANQFSLVLAAPNTAGQSIGPLIQAGTNSADTSLQIRSAATGNRDYLNIHGDGATVFGNATDNPAYTFQGTGTASFAGGVVAGAPTGGNKGVGTLNATGLFINGAAVNASGAVVYAAKTATTSRASTTTLANDPDLQIAIPSTGTWAIEMMSEVWGTGASTQGFKMAMGFTGTTTTTSMAVGTLGSNTGLAPAGGNGTTLPVDGATLATISTIGNLAGPNGGLNIFATGIMVVTATGTFAITWAQNTSSASATNVGAGWIRATKLA